MPWTLLCQPFLCVLVPSTNRYSIGSDVIIRDHTSMIFLLFCPNPRYAKWRVNSGWWNNPSVHANARRALLRSLRNLTRSSLYKRTISSNNHHESDKSLNVYPSLTVLLLLHSAHPLTMRVFVYYPPWGINSHSFPFLYHVKYRSCCCSCLNYSKSSLKSPVLPLAYNPEFPCISSSNKY